MIYALSFALLCLALFWRNARRKQVGVLPSYRIVDHGIRCQDCGRVMQDGRPPYARTVCGLCKTDSYYL